MVRIGLQIKATLENVKSFKSSTDRDFTWRLQFTCTNCREVLPKYHDLSLTNEIPDEHGKNVHFVCKCKMCSRTSNVTIEEDSISYYGIENEGEYKTIVVFDCRGLEPIKLLLGGGWSVTAVDDKDFFEDVDLSEAYWADYSTKIKEPVSITIDDHKFVRLPAVK